MLHSTEGLFEDLGQFTIQCSLFWALWQDTCQSSKNVLINHIISKGPSAISQTPPPLPRTEELSSSACYLPTKASSTKRLIFILFYLFLRRELMKSTRTDTTFLSASWTSLTRNQNEISQHSKELSDENLIPKPTGKGKKFERFRSDLLLALERRCWGPGSAALLCL